VGREHVVVRIDDADIRRFFSHHPEFVVARQGCKGMRYIGATKAIGTTWTVCCDIQTLQVGVTRWLATLAYALGDLFYDGV
jgi:hypothetical protein